MSQVTEYSLREAGRNQAENQMLKWLFFYSNWDFTLIKLSPLNAIFSNELRPGSVQLWRAVCTIDWETGVAIAMSLIGLSTLYLQRIGLYLMAAMLAFRREKRPLHTKEKEERGVCK